MFYWCQLIVLQIVSSYISAQTTEYPLEYQTIVPVSTQQSQYTILTDPRNLQFWIYTTVIAFLACLFGSIWICLCVRCRTRQLRQKYLVAKEQALEQIKSISETVKSGDDTSEIKLKSPSSFVPNEISIPSIAVLPSPPLSSQTDTKQMEIQQHITYTSLTSPQQNELCIESSESDENLITKANMLHPLPATGHSNYSIPNQRKIDGKPEKPKWSDSKLKKYAKKKHFLYQRKTSSQPSTIFSSDVDSVDVDEIVIDTENDTYYTPTKLKFKRSKKTKIQQHLAKNLTMTFRLDDSDKSTYYYSDGVDDIYLVNEMEKEFIKNCNQNQVNKQNKIHKEREFSVNLKNNLHEEKLITNDIVNSMEIDLSSPKSQNDAGTENTLTKVPSHETSNGENIA